MPCVASRPAASNAGPAITLLPQPHLAGLAEGLGKLLSIDGGVTCACSTRVFSFTAPAACNRCRRPAQQTHQCSAASPPHPHLRSRTWQRPAAPAKCTGEKQQESWLSAALLLRLLQQQLPPRPEQARRTTPGNRRPAEPPNWNRREYLRGCLLHSWSAFFTEMRGMVCGCFLDEKRRQEVVFRLPWRGWRPFCGFDSGWRFYDARTRNPV